MRPSYIELFSLLFVAYVCGYGEEARVVDLEGNGRDVEQLVRVEVRSSKEHYILGEPIRLIVRATNGGQGTLILPGTLSPVNVPRVKIFGPKVGNVPGREYRAPLWPDQGRPALRCAPGESVELSLLISRFWEIQAPGNYRCEWELALNHKGPAPVSGQGPGAFGRLEREGETTFSVGPATPEEIRGISQELADGFRTAFPRTDPRAYYRWQWKEPLGALLSISAPAALPVQLQLVNEYFETGILADVIEGMPRSGAPEVVRFLDRIAAHPNANLRVKLARLLRFFPQRSVAPLVDRLSQDADPEVRLSLCAYSSATAGGMEFEELRRVALQLSDADPRIRAGAATTLGESGRRPAIGDLHARLHNEGHSAVRMEIVKALHRLGGSIEASVGDAVDWRQLRKELGSADDMSRLAIIQQLGGIKDDRAQEALFEISKGSSGTELVAALMGLDFKNLAEGDRAEIAEHLLVVGKGEDPFVVFHAITALCKVAPQQYVTRVAPFMASKDRMARLASAIYLRNAGTPEALQILRRAAKIEKDAQVLSVIRKALEAAEKRPQSDTAPRLPAD